MNAVLAAVVIVFAVVAVPSQTAGAQGFTGPYAVSFFTLTNSNADGFVNTNAPTSVDIFGGNNGSFAPGDTSYTVSAAATGLVSFHWAYHTADTGAGGALFDPAGFVKNGVFTQYTDDNGGANQTGNAMFSVTAGDIFGFRVHTTDNRQGRGDQTITNFIAPLAPVASTPEFGSVFSLAGLLIAGGAGLWLKGRRRHRG